MSVAAPLRGDHNSAAGPSQSARPLGGKRSAAPLRGDHKNPHRADSSRALWFVAQGNAALRAEPLPAPGRGCSMLRSLFSAISPGTERLVFAGEVPSAMRETMRVSYMGGDFGFPVKYGYSLVARVEASDDAALEGQLVHLLHPHQDVLIAANEDLFVVPPGIDEACATLASNLETAVNAVWDSGVTIGQSCLVVGFGIIGSLVARLLSRIPGVTVAVADRDETKTVLATKLGFDAFAPEDVAGPFDLAFHASASAEGLQLCIDRTGFEGRIIDASWYGTREVHLALGGSFHSERKRIISTQVSAIPPELVRRWTYRRRKSLVFDLLRDPVFARHITQVITFAELPAWYNGGGLTRPGLARVVDYRRPT